ncbi:MAG: trypsin-like peptidase domain-containing protein [Planctomycetaceae bacterium]
MTVEVNCRSCHYRFHVNDEYAGKLIRCPECRIAVAVPKIGSPARGVKSEERTSQEVPSVRLSQPMRSASAPVRSVQRPPDRVRPDPSRYRQMSNQRTIMLTAAGVVLLGLVLIAGYMLGQSGNASDDPIADGNPSVDDGLHDNPAMAEANTAHQEPNDREPSTVAGNGTIEEAFPAPGPAVTAADQPVVANPGYDGAAFAGNSTAIAASPGNPGTPPINPSVDFESQDRTVMPAVPAFTDGQPSAPDQPSIENQPQTERRELNLADLIEKVQPSVVRVDVDSVQGSGHGSGFVIDAAGIIVTNYHVVEGATKAIVCFKNGDKIPVDGFLYLSAQKDIAILKINPNAGNHPLQAIQLSPSAPRQGTSVAALGAPYGLDFTVSEGIISAVRLAAELKESIGFDDHEGTWIQTTSPISPGNSGGPLVDRFGDVVAINTITMVVGQNLNFGISAEDIRQGMFQMLSSPMPVSPTSAPVRGHVAEPSENGELVDAVGTERALQLMKSLKTFRVLRVAKSYDVLGTVLTHVNSEARDALSKAGLRESVAANAMLLIMVNQQSAGTGSRLILKSQLLVEQRVAGQEQLVMIWEQTEEVGGISDQALFSGVLPSNLKKNIEKYFRNLRVEIAKAQKSSE